MKPGSDRFSRVLALARRARVADPRAGDADAVGSLPPGLATRVAAVWAGSRALGGWELWDRVSRWGVVAGLVICAVTFFLRSGKDPSAPAPTPFDQFVLGSVPEAKS